MITVNDPALEQMSALEFVFDSFTDCFNEWPELPAEKRLERLVFRVSSAPKSLRAHIQRIHYCFDHYLNDQLFGALADLVIVLHTRGSDLKKRMILGSRSRLTDGQFQLLMKTLDGSDAVLESSLDSRFSLFGKGHLSHVPLVHVVEDEVDAEHDPLVLARDYIEYSQLDEALKVLERAIYKDPGRMELQEELLALFRSTRDRVGIVRVYDELNRQGIPLSAEWNDLYAVLKD